MSLPPFSSKPCFFKEVKLTHLAPGADRTVGMIQAHHWKANGTAPSRGEPPVPESSLRSLLSHPPVDSATNTVVPMNEAGSVTLLVAPASSSGSSSSSSGGSGPTTRHDNIRKWQAFGVDTSKYVSHSAPCDTAPVRGSNRDVRPVLSAAVSTRTSFSGLATLATATARPETVSVPVAHRANMVDKEVSLPLRKAVARPDRLPQPTLTAQPHFLLGDDDVEELGGSVLSLEPEVSPSMPSTTACSPPPLHGPCLTKAQGEEEALQSTTCPAPLETPMQQRLRVLSTKVEEALQKQRCGPPKATPGSGSSAGGTGGASRFFGKRFPARKGKSKRSNSEGGVVDKEEEEEEATNDEAHVADGADNTKRASRGGVSKKARAEPKTSEDATKRKKPPKGSGSSKRAVGAPGNGESALGGSAPNNAKRTLFCFQSPATSSTLQVVKTPYQDLDRTEALFHDVEVALNDPDRIQSPPLFTGFLTTHSEGHTNFSISAVSAGKWHLLPHVHPQQAHTCVAAFALCWKDAVYVVKADIGFRFLLRVLRELPGVEVITFGAPSLLLPLMAFAKDGEDVVSTCISDVRLMGWMAHVTGSTDSTVAEAITDFSRLQQLSLGAHGNSAAAAASSLPSLITPGDPLQTLVNQVFYLAPLYRSLYGQLGASGLLQAFLRQEKRVSLLLASMKRNGVLVSLDEVDRFKASCLAQMQDSREKACALVPELVGFNIQSHEQCRQAIYDVLGLGQYLLEADGAATANASGSAVTITKGGKLSTAEDTLRVLAKHHAFPRLLIQHRKAAKLLQTYVEGMMAFAVPWSPTTASDAALPSTANREDAFVDHALYPSATSLNGAQTAEGEVLVTSGGGEGSGSVTTTASTPRYATLHASFLQEGTDTGRLSCVEPNLQNLPRSTMLDPSVAALGGEEGLSADELAFRRCFVAPPGHVLLSVDYQQIELRVLAHLCGDPALVEALTKSTDIHRAIAEKLFRKHPVSSEERTLAKRVVFGVLYGAGPRTLAAQLDVSVERALQVSSSLKTAFPHIDTYHHRVIDHGRADGFVRTISGRLRYLPDLSSTVMGKRAYAERQAFNTVVQGSAADVMKMAMLAVDRDVLQLYRKDVRLLLQIHDEMVFTVKKEKLAEVVPLVTGAMSRAMSLLVPLVVTAKFGPSLGDLVEWSIEHELGVESVE